MALGMAGQALGGEAAAEVMGMGFQAEVMALTTRPLCAHLANPWTASQQVRT